MHLEHNAIRVQTLEMARQLPKSQELIAFQQEVSELILQSLDQDKVQLEKSWYNLNPYLSDPCKPEFLCLLLHLDIEILVRVLGYLSLKGTFLNGYYNALAPAKKSEIDLKFLVLKTLEYLDEKKHHEQADRVLNALKRISPKMIMLKECRIYIKSIEELGASQDIESCTVLRNRLNWLIGNRNQRCFLYQRASCRQGKEI